MDPKHTFHDVWLVAYDAIQPLDLVGPHSVFDAANQLADARGHNGLRYRLHVVAETAGPIRGESGLAIHADNLPEATPGSGAPIRGTLLLPGGTGSRERPGRGELLLDWIRRAHDSVDRVATVCTGAFIAAAAGLLSGRRVVTHWAFIDTLAAEYPDLEVDPDAIWVRDGDVWTSAGVTAGIDLALALVEEDMGTKIAQEVSQWLVVFLRRPGGQSQFAAPVWSRPAETAPVRKAQELILADPAAELSVDSLAAEVGLSARHFTRRFRSEVGATPARYVEQVRLEAARQQLETSNAGMAVIAAHCGFGTAETLRRSFQRRLGVSPDDYRKRFADRVSA